MQALTVLVRIWAALAVVLMGAVAVSAQPAATDPLARARQLYNAGQYDEAITAAREAATRASVPERSPPAARPRAAGAAPREPHDRRSGWCAFGTRGCRCVRALRSRAPRPRRRTGRGLYLDGQYRSAASLLEPALEQMGLLSPAAREQVVDWWGTAMDRYAQTRPPDERWSSTTRSRHGCGCISPGIPIPRRPRTGCRRRRWRVAISSWRGTWRWPGWVRSTLAPDKGVSLRTDLDRLVTQAIIPERVNASPTSPMADAAAARFASEWDEAKGRWKR